MFLHTLTAMSVVCGYIPEVSLGTEEAASFTMWGW